MGVLGLTCLWIDALRDDAIFLDKGNIHIPLSAIGNARKQERHFSIVMDSSLIDQNDDVFEIIVVFFQLIEVGNVILGNFELILHMNLLIDDLTENGRSRENPAAARSSLVAHGKRLIVD